MIRVLAICQEDPSCILGGMGTHVRELYRAMAQRSDVEIDLVTMGPGEPGPYMGYQKFPAHELACYKPPMEGMSTLLISDIQMIKTIFRLYVQGHRWDVIHCHEWNSLQTAWAVRDTVRLPLVATMHLCITKLGQIGNNYGTEEEEEPKPWTPPPEDTIYLMNQEGRLVVESNELILCSKAYVDIAHQTFLTDRDINVIYNGIRTDEWHPAAGVPERARSELNLPARPIALFVGRIAEMKGIHEVLDAVESEDTGYCTVLCGEVNANSDEQKENWCVTQRIRHMQEIMPERLRWIGFHEGQMLKDIYSMAEICLMPSTHEPFGIVALEAMSMGKPLISTEVDGLGEIVVDENRDEYSLIIPPGSGAFIAEAMKYLREKPEKREELSALGLQRVKHFDWDVIAGQTMAVYQKAMERAQACQSC